MDKRIFFISNKFRTVDHGPAKFAYKFAEYSKNCVDVVNVTTEKITLPGVEKVNSKSIFFFKSLRDSWSYWRYLKLATKRGDVIIFNTTYISFFTLVFLRGRPIFTFINDDNSFKISGDIGFYARFRLRVFAILDNLIVKRSNLIIVNSLYMQSLVLDTFNIPKSKVFLLYKGLDLREIALFTKGSRKVSSVEPLKILFVKSDYLRGGLPLLLEAINVLKESINVVLTVVGPAKDDCLGRFKGSPFVKFLGKCGQAEVFNLMADSEIFCVPSYKEALGVANLEAMALGCLVVSTNVGGIPEVLDSGNAGRLIDPGSLGQLIRALEDSCDESLANMELKKYAEDFVKRFDINIAISKLIALAQKHD